MTRFWLFNSIMMGNISLFQVFCVVWYHHVLHSPHINVSKYGQKIKNFSSILLAQTCCKNMNLITCNFYMHHFHWNLNCFAIFYQICFQTFNNLVKPPNTFNDSKNSCWQSLIMIIKLINFELYQKSYIYCVSKFHYLTYWCKIANYHQWLQGVVQDAFYLWDNG